MFEPWPDEPDESEVEQRWGNPERDLPRVPEVSTGEMDADPHVTQTFWVSVVFANAAVFGVSLGAMLWYFRGQALLGGVLIGAGLLAGLRTYASYREFKNDDPEAGAAADDERDTPPDAPDATDDDATDATDDDATDDDATDDDATDATDATDDTDVERTVTATSSTDTDTDTADTTTDSTGRNG